jgi:hypothetical protein
MLIDPSLPPAFRAARLFGLRIEAGERRMGTWRQGWVQTVPRRETCTHLQGVRQKTEVKIVGGLVSKWHKLASLNRLPKPFETSVNTEGTLTIAIATNAVSTDC